MFRRDRKVQQSRLAELTNALHQSEALARALKQSFAVIEFTPDGTILRANDNFAKVMRYDVGEVVGQHHRQFVDPAYAASAAYSAFWAELAAGEEKSDRFMRYAKDGRVVWLRASYMPVYDHDGKVERVVKVAQDITSVVDAEAEQQAKMTAIDKTQAVIEFEPDGTIVAANENFEQTMGYQSKEIVGKHHRMFVDPAYANREEYAAFWSALREGKYQSGEFMRFGKGQRRVWLNASYTPVYNAGGEVAKVIKFASDITEEKTNRNKELIGQLSLAIEALSTATSEVEQSSEQQAQSASDMMMRVRQAVASADSVTSHMLSNATAAEELDASISDILQNMERFNEQSNQAVSVTHEAANVMQQLQESSKAIGAIVEVISTIAKQTNLLALNASIEAARAGEAGRGFAVVADQVNSLAQKTAAATEEIAQKIDGIQGETKTAVDSILSIEGVIGEISSIAGGINSSVREQGAATRDIAQAASESGALGRDIVVELGVVANEAAGSADVAENLQQYTVELNAQVTNLLDLVAALQAN